MKPHENAQKALHMCIFHHDPLLTNSGNSQFMPISQNSHKSPTLRKWCLARAHTHSHTHTRLMALFLGLPGWAATRKVKPISILLKQETVSGSSISWTICKFASRSRQINMPVPHHSFFTSRMPFLPPNQQCQSTEGADAWLEQLSEIIDCWYYMIKLRISYIIKFL